MMVPEDLVQWWETAYRRYSEVSKVAATAPPGDREAAREMAAAARDVAAAWRAMESKSDLPWWVLAALMAAAQAFEFQARDWGGRSSRAWPVDVGGQPQVRLLTRARPQPGLAGRAERDG